MTEFFGSVWWLLVSLGLLVTFHEFGHYWVARRCGVRVLRFSVGFGRTLWSRRGSDGTEYVVAALPLGGYVKMLDEREVDVAEHERHLAFNNKSVGQRIAIVAAGPLANLALCVGLLWLMFVIGKPDYLPIIGRVTGPAEAAGLVKGDQIIQIGDRSIATWTDAGVALATAMGDGERIAITVRNAGGGLRQQTLQLPSGGDNSAQTQPLLTLGFFPQQLVLPAVVGKVTADSAANGKLLVGDELLAINGDAIADYNAISPLVQRHAGDGKSLNLRIRRNGAVQEVTITPRLFTENGRTRWIFGVDPKINEAKHDALLRYGPIDAIAAAGRETAQMTSDTLRMLWRMVSGRASLDNISGPITIAKVANSSAGLGVAWFLYFLALLSLSLCIMNLLPIPVLDGGHLLYYLIELVLGRPLGERALEAGQYVGLALLAGLMGLAFYNDILRLVS